MSRALLSLRPSFHSGLYDDSERSEEFRSGLSNTFVYPSFALLPSLCSGLLEECRSEARCRTVLPRTIPSEIEGSIIEGSKDPEQSRSAVSTLSPFDYAQDSVLPALAFVNGRPGSVIESFDRLRIRS